MSEPTPSEAARNRAELRNWRLGLSPIVAAVLLMSAISGVYLSGFLNSSSNIADFPLAVVSQDAGTTLPDGTPGNVDQIAAGLVSGMNGDQFTVVQLTADEAATRMNDASLHGFILIPETFSADLATYAQDAATSQPSSRSG